MYRTRPGLALLLMLMVLATILAAGLTVSALVLRELRITGTSDRGILAFYTAESALEQGLYLYRQQGEYGNLTVNEGDAADAWNNTVSTPASNGTWWRSAEKGEASFVQTVRENETAQVVLFDPDTPGSQAASVRLTWNTNPATCPGEGYGWLEVLQSGWEVATSQTASRRDFFAGADASGVIVNLDGDYPRVRLRALFADICDLRLEAFTGLDAGGSLYTLPTEIRITAAGEVADARQAVSVVLPEVIPQAGFFDYTIFTECSLTKGVIEACP